MRTALIILLLGIAGLMLWVRLAPSDPALWHVDPLTAADPGAGGVRIVPPDAPVFDVAPSDLMAAFDAVAMAAPRTDRLAGSVAEDHVTYIVRSRVWGFPDYVSVRVLPGDAEGTSTLAILSRLRFGRSDVGVNAARMQTWLAEVGARLGS